MQHEDQAALDKLTASGIRIPAQPKVLIELRDKIAGGNFSIRSIASIIGKDPGLVALLFKASRSPAFSRGNKFQKVDQVLQVIGIKQAYNLIQAAALAAATGDTARKAFDKFWTRSGEVAELAAMIAEDQVAVCNVFPDQAYMAGIFHQCGVPVLMLRFPDYCQKLQLDNAGYWPNLAEEDAKFHVDHISIGYLVARHWGLPDFICAAIRYHHEIPPEAAGAAISLVAILQLAVHAYLSIQLQANPAWDVVGARVLEEIGLPAADLDGYLDDLSHRFHERAD